MLALDDRRKNLKVGVGDPLVAGVVPDGVVAVVEVAAAVFLLLF